jgi:hypothetical protein
MKVYSTTGYGFGTIFATPGAHHPENGAWVKQSQGEGGRTIREPIQFTVKFENGVAEVDDQLGQYLIDRKAASRSPLVLPTPLTQKALEDTRPKYAKPIEVGKPLRALGV